ncbi:MAG: hypothetical protein ACI4PR_04625 [Acutalibacteraceae bacterium]
MENIKNLTEKETEKVSGGKQVNFFGFESSTGKYTKCDLCGKYGTVPLSINMDVCLDCLEKIKNIIGQDNTFKLLNINSITQKEILNPTNSVSNNTKKSTN